MALYCRWLVPQGESGDDDGGAEPDGEGSELRSHDLGARKAFEGLEDVFELSLDEEL